MSERVHFREAGPADRAGILRLRSTVFPNEDLEKQRPEFWDWEFMAAPAGRGRIFVGEIDGTIVGHFAVIPQQYAAGRPLLGALAVDAMVHPDFRRERLFTRLAALTSEGASKEFQVATVLQIRQQVLPGLVAGGWQPAEAVPILLRPLSWLGLARDCGIPLRPRATTPRRDSAAQIRLLADSDLEKLDPLVAVQNPRQPRTPAFLRWRYLSSPGRRYDLRGFFEADELRAFVISRETVLRGMRTLAIADAGASDAAAMKRLLRSVCDEAAERRTSLAAALLSRAHPAFRFFTTTGFFRGPHQFRLLLQTFDQRLSEVAGTAWSLSWGDTDHL